MSGLRLGVETEDEDELEVGACIYSKSIHYGNAYDGGTIIAMVIDADDRVVNVTCLAGWDNPSSPRLVTLDRADLNMESVTWWAKNARRAADALMAWLSNPRRQPKDAGVRARWTVTAAQLAEAGVGTYLPGAERRYQADFAARRAEQADFAARRAEAARPPEPVDVDPDEIERLVAELEQPVNDARDRHREAS